MDIPVHSSDKGDPLTFYYCVPSLGKCIADCEIANDCHIYCTHNPPRIYFWI